MSALLDLAARCEAATGADRRLDAMIAAAVDRPNPNDPDRNLAVHDQIVARLLAGGDDSEIARYTASLDAALALVPEEAFWRLGHDGEGGDPSLFLATVLQPQPTRASRPYDAVADTPALALCAAALRACAALADGERADG